MNCFFGDNELDQMLFVLLYMCKRFMDLLKNVQNKPFFKFSSATCICNLNIIYQWVPAFLCDDKMCTWHTIPWLNSWNKLKFKIKFSVYLWHFRQQELDLQGPRSLLFMNQRCVGSLMFHRIFILMYDVYYDLSSLMARRIESLTVFSCH